LGDLLDPKLFNERLEIRRQEVDWLLQQYGAKPPVSGGQGAP
jgi:hypothetical protein